MYHVHMSWLFEFLWANFMHHVPSNTATGEIMVLFAHFDIDQVPLTVYF